MITDDYAPPAGADGDESAILALLEKHLRTCYSGCRRHPSREGIENAVEHALLALAELCYSAPEIRALLAARLEDGRATYGPWHVATDPRDLEHREPGEEFADGALYLAAGLLRVTPR